MKNENTTKSCPLGMTGFCWKNPLHLVVFFAALPYAVKGLSWLAKGVAGWFN
jgi:hypothetical protein